MPKIELRLIWLYFRFNNPLVTLTFLGHAPATALISDAVISNQSVVWKDLFSTQIHAIFKLFRYAIKLVDKIFKHISVICGDSYKIFFLRCLLYVTHR